MKIAIVTGASSGLGKEFVKIIDQACPMLDEIWVIARRKERMEQLQHHVKKPLRILTMDLAKKESAARLHTLLTEKRPQVYALVCAAGFGKYGRNIHLDMDDTMGMIDVNVSALTAVTQSVLPWMVKSGRILLLASSAAFLPQPGFGVYAASKSYVLSYARSLNTELCRKKIYVTAVCPGPVATEFFAISGSGGALSVVKSLFMAQPDKVAKKAWHDAMKRKDMSVYGISMKLFLGASKILPHKIILKGMGFFQ